MQESFKIEENVNQLSRRDMKQKKQQKKKNKSQNQKSKNHPEIIFN